MREKGRNKVVLAYSGGLDSTALIILLKENYGFKEVIPVLVDVGQGNEDINIAKERARLLGVDLVYIDSRKEFVTDYIHKCIKANGSYHGYPIGTSMSRVLIASKVVEVAEREGADAVAHGCTGKGNDQFRMEATFKYLAPELEIVAPVRELNLVRAEEEELLRKHGIDPTKRVGKIGGDINMWSHSIGSGQIEDLTTQVETDYIWAVPLEDAPDEPTLVTIRYENGVPTSVDGITDPVAIIERLNKVCGENGVGRIDIMEDGILGLKSREIYEAPAATVLLKTHSDLEHLTLTKEQLRLKHDIDRLWADMVYHGMWFHPLKRDLDAFIDSTQRYVNGKVTVKLYKGNVNIVARESSNALFFPELRSIKKATLDQRAMKGVVDVFTMQYKLYKMRGL